MMDSDRLAELALPLGIILIGLASLLNLLAGDADPTKFVGGVLLGLGIAAEVFAMYGQGRKRSA